MVFVGYSGFLHYLQLASHELATIGINVTKNKIQIQIQIQYQEKRILLYGLMLALVMLALGMKRQMLLPKLVYYPAGKCTYNVRTLYVQARTYGFGTDNIRNESFLDVRVRTYNVRT